MKRLVLLGVQLFFLALAAEGASIYKWVDENGVTQYSATPPASQKAQQIQTQPAPPAANADSGMTHQKGWQEIEQELAERKAAQTRDEAKTRNDALGKQQKCIRARQTLDTLLKQGPKYRLNEKGEKVFWDDKFLDSEIERNKKEVDENCAS
jgi:hypothetical protein